MNEQLRITQNDEIKGEYEAKVEMAIQRLKAFEPKDGYYVAFSGGKDSQCIYHLCQMAGVKFDAHYNVTSVDPPELIYFIREHYPDVEFVRQHYDDGKPEHYYANGQPKQITMWSLIQDIGMSPSRQRRFCCKYLKETNGRGRLTVTGVRWAESEKRKHVHGVADFNGKPKKTIYTANEIGATYKLNKHGEVILNDDNDENRRMVEHCYRTQTTLVNPIVDWTDDDVWHFLNTNGIPHCKLYDEGFSRLGCIGCPLAGPKQMVRQFERWPKYKEAYYRAFGHVIAEREKKGTIFRLARDADGMMRFFIHADKDELNEDEGLLFE